MRNRNLVVAVVGLAVGLGLGLLYAWGISPVAYKDTTPASLGAANKAAYLRLVAQAYVVEGNLDRARSRLAALGEPSPAPQIAALAQQAAAAGENAQTVRALAALASALGAGPQTPTAAPTPTARPTATRAPTPTSTPRPTVTPYLLPTHAPTLTPPGVFMFSGKRLICDANLKQPLIQVLTVGTGGEPVPGVEVIVKWADGNDHFFTGLKPELGPGYGDFVMQPNVDYTVYLASNPAAAVAGLTTEMCTGTEGQTYSGSWQLLFSQP
jgi:hypothetical protein